MDWVPIVKLFHVTVLVSRVPRNNKPNITRARSNIMNIVDTPEVIQHLF